MNRGAVIVALLTGTVWFATLGCEAPGKPVRAEVARPDEVLDFSTLYKQNCAACHGQDGKGGASLPLANPIYLAVAGTDNIQRITVAGVPGTAMPPFATSRGGTLSDRQIAALVKGLMDKWGRAELSEGKTIAYAASAPGDPVNGKAAFTTFCARCHGADGTGLKRDKAPTSPSEPWTGSIVDPSYLALVSDQYLRSTIIAGRPDQKMPDWHSLLTGPNARPMSDQEITDTVAWMVSHRVATPGEPYPQHP